MSLSDIGSSTSAVWKSSISTGSWNDKTDLWASSTSTGSSADTEGSSVYSHPLYKSSYYIWSIGSPLILLVGNFGNIMIIIIMRRKKSGEAIINICFTALAIVDLVVLDILLLVEWIGVAFGYVIHVQNDFLCKIRNWIGGSTTAISAWFLVCLTAHRAVSVVWPHRVNALCTRRLVVGALMVITFFFSAVYSHYLYGYQLSYIKETKKYICIMFSESYATFVREVFSFIYLVIYCVLPFLCIFAANSVLVWKLKSTIQEVRHQFAEKESVAARKKAASSVTLTIITVSVTFIVLTLPASVYFITFLIFGYSASIDALIRAIVFMLVYCNNLINFYLYCLTGSKFRKEFVSMFSRQPQLA